MSGRRHVGWRVIWRETWRNVASGTTRVTLATLLLAVCMALLVCVDCMAITSLTARSRAWVDAGASTYVLALSSGIDGAACDRLASLNGVRAAGATRQISDKLKFATLPSMGVPVIESTPGFPEVFGGISGSARGTMLADGRSAAGRSNGMGILLSEAVAEQLGATAGSVQSLSDGRKVVVRDVYQYPDDGRESGYGFAAVVPMNDDAPYSFCIVRTWPTPEGIEAIMRTAIVPSYAGEDKPRVAQLNASLGRTAPSMNDYRNRATAWVPWFMLVLSAVLGFALIHVRQLEFAGALHAGYPKMALAAQVLVEMSIAFLAAALIISPVFAYVALDVPAVDLRSVFDALIRIPVAADVGLLAGAFVSLALTREHQLFNYFKRR